MSFRPDELQTRLTEAEAALEWDGERGTARDLLSGLEAWAATEAEDQARYRLVRGLARYLVDRDEEAREDYLAALRLSHLDGPIRLRALCRLAQLDTYHERFDQAERWLAQAEIISTEIAPTGSLVAELEFRRGQLAVKRGELVQAQLHFTTAGTLFLDARLESRWLAARLGSADASLKTNVELDFAEHLGQVRSEASSVGLEPQQVVAKLVDLATTAYLKGHRAGVAEWLDRLGEEEFVGVPSSDRTLVGLVLHRSGRVAKGLQHFQAAAESDDIDDRWFAQLHIRALLPADHSAAVEENQSLITHAREGVALSVSSTSLLAASKLLMDAGSFGAAEELCRTIRDRAESTLLVAGATVNLIGVLLSRGELPAAIGLRRSLDLGALAGDAEMLGVARLNDAYLCVVRGQWEEAAGRVADIVEDLRRVGDKTQLAMALLNASEWAALCGQTGAREEYLEDLVELVGELTGLAGAAALLTIGSALREDENWALASASLDAASEVAREFELDRIAILAALNRAWVILDYPYPSSTPEAIREAALDGLESQLKTLESRCKQIPDLLGFVQRTRGLVALRFGLGAVGERHFRRAANAFAQAGRIYDHADALDWAARVAEDELRAIRYAERATRAGIGLVALSSTEGSRVQALARMRPMGAWLVQLHARRGDGIAAASAIYQVKAGEFLSETAGSSESVSAAAMIALERAAVPVSMASVATKGPSVLRPSPTRGLRPVLSRLTPKELFEEPRVADARVSAGAVLRWLSSDEAAVEYFIDPGLAQVLMVVLHRGRARVVKRRLASAHVEAIENVAEVAAGRLFGGDPRWLRATLRQLHQLLIAPLGSLPTRLRRIWFAPGGLLSSVPFGALLDAEMRPLIDVIDLRLLVTTAQLALNRRARPKLRSAVVLRGRDNHADALLHADRECDAVRAMLARDGVRVLTDMTAETLKSADVLHYAGHGRFDAASAVGSLPLPGYDFGSGDLARLRLERRPLVVLSACESGAGAAGADGLTGFVRGAFAAGARNIVCSGWVAEDRATLALMTAFYEHLAQHGEPSRALRLATQDLFVARPEWRHPFYWANFRCYGVG